jgi:hypothetical protein
MVIMVVVCYMVKYILNIENFKIFVQNLLNITGRYRYDINFNLAKINWLGNVFS